MRGKVLARVPGVWRDTSGAQIAEAALVLPVLFILLLAILALGRAYSVYTTVNYAAREGARVAARPACAVCSPAGFPSDSEVATKIGDVLSTARLDPSLVDAYDPSPVLNACPGVSGCTTVNGVRICRNVRINPGSSSGPQACGVSVNFRYPYQFHIPFMSINAQTIWIRADVQMRGEY
jgi:TadE-like protein